MNDLISIPKIVGIIGNSGSGKSNFISRFKNDKKTGIVNNDTVKCNLVDEQLEYYVKLYKFKLPILEDRKTEIMKMLNIDKSILNQSIYEISESEYAKVLIASILLYNPEVIIVDEYLEALDFRSKNKVLKLFIKLKKFFKKKIIIITSNIDDIYEFIDDIIVIDDGKVLLEGKKSILFDNIDMLYKRNIKVPYIVSFIDKMRLNNIKLDRVDTINELIKTLYREMR